MILIQESTLMIVGISVEDLFRDDFQQVFTIEI